MLLLAESQIQMSAVRFQIIITEPAQVDFRDLLSYTMQMWGHAQFVLYRDKINAALSALAENPKRGRKKHGVMVYLVAKHQVFYRIQDTTVYIMRILHNRMDAAQHITSIN